MTFNRYPFFRSLATISLTRAIITALLMLSFASSFGQVERPIGINLSPVTDFSTEFVFVDAFRQSRIWISHNADGSGAWDTSINIPLDENGYPLAIPYDDGVNPPQAVRALVLWDLPEPFPSGEYRLIVEGEGQVSMEFGASGTFTCPVNTLVSVTGASAIRIDASSAENPISKIRLIRPGYTDGLEDQTFTDDFLTFLEDFQVIRFMDWMQTNNSPLTQWSDRTQADFYTQTTAAGVAYEYITELANNLEKDIWINIPHQAEDSYVTELAEFLESNLNPDSRIYLEYSNEVWNGIFLQSAYASEMGNNLGFTGPFWEQGWKYTAYRSAQVFSLFEAAIDNGDRLVKIIPSQSASAWLSGQLVNYFNDPQYNPGGIEADALAIAPYFANGVANDIVANDEVSTITVEEIVERMANSLSQTQSEIADNMTVAETANIELIAYEGGQHLVGTDGNENIDVLTQKLTAANHHPDLQDVYCDYLNFWYLFNGGLFAHFNSHYPFSKWGSWGVKETMDDFDNPKYLALQNCVFDANTLSTSESSSPNTRIIAYPNPSDDGQFRLTNLSPQANLAVYDIAGKEVEVDFREQSDDVLLELTRPRSGIYILRSGSQAVRLVVR